MEQRVHRQLTQGAVVAFGLSQAARTGPLATTSGMRPLTIARADGVAARGASRAPADSQSVSAAPSAKLSGFRRET